MITPGNRYWFFLTLSIGLLSLTSSKKEKTKVLIFMFVYTIVSHFTAGLVKLFSPDNSWIDGSAIEFLISDKTSLYLHYSEYISKIPKIFFQTITYLVLVIELSGPLFLFNSKVRKYWLFGALSLHTGIFVLMDIKLISFQVATFLIYLLIVSQSDSKEIYA